MIYVHINNVEYFLPKKKENNLKFLSQIGKKIRSGSYVLLVGFGVGPSWGITLIKKN